MKKTANLLLMLGMALGLVLGVAGHSGATQVNDTELSIFPYSAGSGNSNQHFAVDKNGLEEVGLKAKIRYGADIIPDGNVYHVLAGSYPGVPTYANWNFDFSAFLGENHQWYLAYDVDPSTAVNYKFLPVVPASYQDSWNYGMNFLGTGFNPNLDATYDIALSILGATGGPGLTSHIQVVVGNGGTQVPEPATMLLLGLGLMGLAGVRRKFKK